MNLSLNVIKAVANLYSLDELQIELQKATVSMLENPNAIISASTGSGASYQRMISMTAQDMVELLTYALEYKQTGSLSAGGNNIMPTISLII